MKILAVSDHVSDVLYRRDMRNVVGDVDLLLACGDLPYSYLEYLVTTLKVPRAYYVHGNHDADEIMENGGLLLGPGGWVNVDRRVVMAGGLLIAGLEGSIRYKPRAHFQYTEAEQRWRTLWLLLRLLWSRWRYRRGLDIIIAHSPPAGIHDGPDGPHRGFKVFLTLMHWFRPRLFLHGHKHHYGPETWRTRYEATEVVNVYPFRLIEWDGETITYGRIYRR